MYDPCDRQNRGGRGTYVSEQERSLGASAARRPGGVWYLPVRRIDTTIDAASLSCTVRVCPAELRYVQFAMW